MKRLKMNINKFIHWNVNKTKSSQKYAIGVKGAPMGGTKLGKNGKTYILSKKLDKNRNFILQQKNLYN